MERFADPSNKKSQGLSNEELARLVRCDLAHALKTVNRYGEHLEVARDEAAAKVLEHLRDEEKHHFGELLALLQYLDPEEAQHYAEGAAEAAKLLMQLGIDSTTAGSEEAGTLVVTKPAPLVPLCDIPVKPGKRAKAEEKKGAKKGKGDKEKKASKKNKHGKKDRERSAKEDSRQESQE